MQWYRAWLRAAVNCVEEKNGTKVVVDLLSEHLKVCLSVITFPSDLSHAVQNVPKTKKKKKHSTASLCWVPDATIKKKATLWYYEVNMNATSVLPVCNASKQCLQDFINIPLLFQYSICYASCQGETHSLTYRFVLYGCTRREHIFLGSRKSQTYWYISSSPTMKHSLWLDALNP